MKYLKQSEFEDWCKKHGLKIAANRIPSFVTGESRYLSIATVKDEIGFWLWVLPLLTNGDYETEFNGGVGWIRETGIAVESIDEVGYLMFDKIFRSADVALKEDARAIEFQTGEELLTLSLLYIAVLAEWAVVFVNREASVIVIRSHDGYISIVSRSQYIESKLLERYGEICTIRIESDLENPKFL